MKKTIAALNQRLNQNRKSLPAKINCNATEKPSQVRILLKNVKSFFFKATALKKKNKPISYFA